MTFDTIYKGSSIVTHNNIYISDIAVKNGKIVEIGDLSEKKANQTIDLKGYHLLPGVIDTQVHFREPGLEYKEDLNSGTKAAVLGGITAVFEMPNTNPATTNEDALKEKLKLAEGRLFCDYAFYVGGTEDNYLELPKLEKIPGCCGVKVFMGLSIGSLLVSEDNDLDNIVSNINNRASFHCEDQDMLEERIDYQISGDIHSHEVWRNDEQCFRATQRIVGIARKNKKNIHVLHVSTRQEIEFLSKNKDIASVEITPQHLTLNAPECYNELGSYAQMNPPIRNLEHQKKLWEGINDGTADIIGSDHAPHTKDEKNAEYPSSPSGMPGVQTLVPVMLNHVNAGKLTLERFVELTSYNPSMLFKIKEKGQIAIGFDADFTVVDMNKKRVITDDWIVSKCGWTPYNNMEIKGWPIMTIIRDNIVMQDDKISDPLGKPMNFVR